MCFGPCTTYAKCGHQKLEIVDTCQAGLNPQGDCKRGIFNVTRHKTSQTPSLCVHCYRRHVDDVIARYNRQITEKDQKIALISQHVGDIADKAQRQRMRLAISSEEVVRGELIDARYAELEEFRIQQGVWGDGGLYAGYTPFGTRAPENHISPTAIDLR
ncbi:MAG: hypothetical protein Q9216_005343 [Gyalolechia sp. 2 TL-2023]